MVPLIYVCTYIFFEGYIHQRQISLSLGDLVLYKFFYYMTKRQRHMVFTSRCSCVNKLHYLQLDIIMYYIVAKSTKVKCLFCQLIYFDCCYYLPKQGFNSCGLASYQIIMPSYSYQSFTQQPSIAVVTADKINTFIISFFLTRL